MIDALAGQCRMVRAAFHQPEIGRAFRYGILHLPRIADAHIQPDIGIGGVKGGQPPGQPIAGDGLAGGDRQRAARRRRQILKRGAGGRRAVEDGAGLGQEAVADIGQLDAAPDAVEQPRAVMRLNCADRRRNRRLRHAEAFGGARHMPAFGDCDKDAKLFKRHGK
jgi:hypothetical protein